MRYDYDALNRISYIHYCNGVETAYTYDKAGNRIRKTDVQGENRYLYNEKNHLIAEESPVDRKQFSYDHQGV